MLTVTKKSDLERSDLVCGLQRLQPANAFGRLKKENYFLGIAARQFASFDLFAKGLLILGRHAFRFLESSLDLFFALGWFFLEAIWWEVTLLPERSHRFAELVSLLFVLTVDVANIALGFFNQLDEVFVFVLRIGFFKLFAELLGGESRGRSPSSAQCRTRPLVSKHVSFEFTPKIPWRRLFAIAVWFGHNPGIIWPLKDALSLAACIQQAREIDVAQIRGTSVDPLASATDKRLDNFAKSSSPAKGVLEARVCIVSRA